MEVKENNNIGHYNQSNGMNLMSNTQQHVN